MGYLIINNDLEIPILGFQEQAQKIENDRTGNDYVMSMSVVIDLDQMEDKNLNILYPYLIDDSVTSLGFKSAKNTDIIYTSNKYDHIQNINTNFGDLVGASDIKVQAQINLETPIDTITE